jgi:hypothetical protein
MSRFISLVALALAGGINCSAAFAFPIASPGTEGLEVFVKTTAPVVATYQGNSASYSNDLYLMLDGSGNPGDDGNPANDTFIFNNHASSSGSTVSLGSFPVGTKLMFRMRVNNTGTDYFTGLASRNPDSHTHARVQANWTSTESTETLVSFEDLFDGPFDYNDLSFSFTNVQSGAGYTLVQSIRVADLNNSQAPEEAALVANNISNTIQVWIRDSVTRVLLKTLSFATGSYTPLGLAEVPDLNNSGKPEIAVLFRNGTTGVITVAIRDAWTGALIKQISFGSGLAQSVTALEDTNGNGAPELAVLLLVPNSTAGAYRLDVRDTLSGALLRSIAMP